MNTIAAIPYRLPFVLPFSWDDSSSVSSGLSDTLDNISTDDLNTPVYSAGSSSRKSRGGGEGAQVKPQILSHVLLVCLSVDCCGARRSTCLAAFADANHCLLLQVLVGMKCIDQTRLAVPGALVFT